MSVEERGALRRGGAVVRSAVVAGRDALLRRGPGGHPRSGRGGVVLAYHDVLPDGAPGFEYAVALGRLRSQLDVVARLRLDVVPLAELAARLLAGRSTDGLVALVFDDALSGAAERALPELARRGWPSVLAPVTERLGALPPWWPGSGPTAPAAALRRAVGADGGPGGPGGPGGLGGLVDVAGHSTTHHCLPCLPQPELERQLTASRRTLSELASRDVRELVYPFGHHDERVVTAARAAGWTTGWTFLNGRATAGTHPFRLPRLTMTQGLTPARLALHLARRPQDWPHQTGPAVHPAHAPVPGSAPGAAA